MKTLFYILILIFAQTEAEEKCFRIRTRIMIENEESDLGYISTTRNLGARLAPISSWWPSATLLALRACLTSSFTPFGHSSRVLLHVKGGG